MAPSEIECIRWNYT